MTRDYDIETILGVPFEETPETLAYDMSSKVSVQVSQILEKRGMTLKELADTMGITQPSLCKMLGAKSNMTMKTVAKIALALGCDVEPPVIKEDARSPESMEFKPFVMHSDVSMTLKVIPGRGKKRHALPSELEIKEG